MDEYGFFIYWKSEGREGDVKELSQFNDIRGGKLPKVKKNIPDQNHAIGILPVQILIFDPSP